MTNIEQVAIGIANTCVIDSTHQLFCWGENASGEVGNNTTTDVLTPTKIMDAVADVSIGQIHACAATIDGHLHCWGANSFGNLGLGNGSVDDVLTPTQVGTWTDYEKVACGVVHTCARRSNGVACWGGNFAGQLGLSDTIDRDTPAILNLSAVDSLYSGGAHTGAVIDGDVYMWGDNASRQLGTDEPFDAMTPTRISVEGIVRLALGLGFSCALALEGRVLCWGSNGSGELGDGTTTDRATPTAVVWP